LRARGVCDDDFRMRTEDRAPSRYRSYSYLRAGSDFEEFEFPAEIGRVASTAVSVTPEQEERVQRLLGGEFVILLHDHPTRRPAATGGRDGKSRATPGCPSPGWTWSSTA
jgi:hypothetical protein